MIAFVYPVVAYWAWSGMGFLNYTNDAGDVESPFGPPYMDFAGSGVVHLVGGVGALCGAIIVGPRMARFNHTIAEEDFEVHNVPFVVLAKFFPVVWLVRLQSRKHSLDAPAGLAVVNTTLSPCVAGLTVFLLRAKVVPPRRKDVCGYCNGILAGLVAITAGCGFIKHWEAIIIGFIGGLVYQAASMLLVLVHFDDVDALPVHGACGAWGALAVDLFGDSSEGAGGNGLFHGGDQFRVQLIAMITMTALSATFCTMVFLPLQLRSVLRLTDEYQERGSVAMEHAPARAYQEQKTEVVGLS